MSPSEHELAKRIVVALETIAGILSALMAPAVIAPKVPKSDNGGSKS